MKSAEYITSLLFCCMLIYTPIAVNAAPENDRALPPVSEETEICIECHINYSPGIVEDWLKSRHAAVTPGDASKKSQNERRVSAETFADDIRSVAVGCYECHSLNPGMHEDNFEHAGISINVVVSPNDCKACHPVEVDQYMGSKKAHAVGNLRENPVYHSLVETILGLKESRDGKMVRLKPSDSTNQEACYACHGTEVKVEWMKEVSTDVGDMKMPVLSNWPNQGVGRINPDGSRGSCTSCHPRHSFSIEIARKPYTCAQCHLEPDVPAWNVYKESKHGNIYFSKHDEWNWDEVPWKLGRDFGSPTCAVCHNSLVVTSEGRTIVPRTHNFGDRLWLRIFGLIYSHPQPEKGDTYTIKNKDGLPLPTTFSGALASEHLINQKEQAGRQTRMENLCKSCHGSTWVNGHFTKMHGTVAEVDKMVLAATQIMSKAWEDGLADKGNPFDESLEHKWLSQWLFYANSVRYASAMTGAPDYAAFKNGWWELTTNLQEMQALVALKSNGAEQPPEPVSEASTGAQEQTGIADETGFGSVDISKLPDADKQYLGLRDGVNPVLRNTDADLVVLEFLSVYCPSCQMQAPIFNQLFSALEKDSSLGNRVKMIGIGVGNNEKEVNQFKESREVSFPILPDPKFTVYEKLVSSTRTPYTVLLKRDKGGDLVMVNSHVGLIRSYESYLAEMKTVMLYDEDMIKLKQADQQAAAVVEKTELKLSGEELLAKVKEAMIRASEDENIAVLPKKISLSPKLVPEREAPEVFEGTSKRTKYFAVVVSRESVCDICHAIQFIYVVDEGGKIVGFEPIHLTKYGNRTWDEKDIEEMRQRILGRSVLQPINFEFDYEVDAVTSATITSAVIFRALTRGRDIFRFLIK